MEFSDCLWRANSSITTKKQQRPELNSGNLKPMRFIDFAIDVVCAFTASTTLFTQQIKCIRTVIICCGMLFFNRGVCVRRRMSEVGSAMYSSPSYGYFTHHSISELTDSCSCKSPFTKTNHDNNNNCS